MPEEKARPNSWTQVIDLTTRATQKAGLEKAMEQFKEPEESHGSLQIADLPVEIRAAVERAGWKELMPVQQQALSLILSDRDIIVQSRTGSGKTGAFLLPLFSLLDPAHREPQALILTPTRELARQIYSEFERMLPTEGQSGHTLQAVPVYGGVKYAPQNKALRDGAQVVIGTPGRILDHLERRTFSLNKLRVLVLDEADEMLSMGFYPAMRQLKRYLPAQRRSQMFSATMPAKVRSLSSEFLSDPAFLSLSIGQESVSEIEHRYYVVPKMEKDRALARLIEMENPDSAIIFSNTKRDVEYLATFLKNFGHDAAEISGDLSQKSREQVMDRIRRGNLRFLVATDVAARGIDISDLSHVFMYDIPQDPEYYVHRSGRTARAGKTGVALVLATAEDERSLLSIVRRYGIEIEKRDIPSIEDVEARISERMTVILEDRLRGMTSLQRERIERFSPMVRELAREEPELLAQLLDELYQQQMHVPAQMPDVEPPERREKSEKPPRGKKKPRAEGKKPEKPKSEKPTEE